jgi:hypothetical protein
MSASEFAKLKGDLLCKLQKDEKESKEDGEVEVDKDFGESKKIRNTKIKDSVNALILVLSCLIIPP